MASAASQAHIIYTALPWREMDEGHPSGALSSAFRELVRANPRKNMSPLTNKSASLYNNKCQEYKFSIAKQNDWFTCSEVYIITSAGPEEIMKIVIVI